MLIMSCFSNVVHYEALFGVRIGGGGGGMYVPRQNFK